MALKSIIANSLWLASAFPSFLNFRRRLAAPQRTQHHNLLHCLSRNKKTVYGRRYAFSEIASYHDFARNVPLVNYDDLEPWINRIKHGEQHVLTRASVTHLIPTSGSTGSGKLIPFTSDLQHQFKLAIGPWIFDLFRDCPALVRGKAYWSITPAVANAQTQSSAVPIGFEEDSSYLGARQKEIVSALMAVPSELRLISDMNIFRY